MRRRAFIVSAVLLAALSLTLGLSRAGAAQKAPEAQRVDVTYYYLPG
jgi:hypothetical protein